MDGTLHHLYNPTETLLIVTEKKIEDFEKTHWCWTCFQKKGKITLETP